MPRTSWRVRTFPTEVDLALVDPPAADRALCQEWARAIEALLWTAITGRDPQVRATLEEVLVALEGGHGAPAGDFTPGPDFDRALASDLKFAAYGGRLRVTPVERDVTVPAVPDAE
jgi:hypothetical protein